MFRSYDHLVACLGSRSVCSFILLVSTVFRYMFRPTWPSSSVSELYCVGSRCLSLHVSAYMTIFKCDGALLCWFPPSFATCFGLHGHLQVCRSFTVSVLAVFHYMFRPTWPSSNVSELYCVGFHCLSLHVSAYMAIFKCVGVIYVGFHCLSLHVSAYMAIFKCVGVIYVGFHCLSLHVSAYMAIFKRVGFFTCLGILLRCFLGSMPFSMWSHVFLT
jgi:hypothetical protein